MKVQIQELAIEHDSLKYRLKFINSPTAVTVDLIGFPMTHRGVNIELVDGQWAFVPAPGFGEVETAKDEQLRDLQAMVRDLAGGYRRLLDENSSLQSQLETAATAKLAEPEAGEA